MDGFQVRKATGSETREYMRENHYTRTCHNGPMGWALIDESGRVRGMIAFATPSSENVRASVFGSQWKDRVTELHRLYTDDDLPYNAGTWFVARALRELRKYRPSIVGVLSFADSTEGHTGGIYAAGNALFLGTTGRAVFYRDTEGRLRHPRQNGVNITRKEAARRGWTPEPREGKYRWLFLIGTPSDKKWGRRNLKLTEHPRPTTTYND